MDEMQRVIRIVFLDFRKAFDLIDHNKLLENIKEMVVRSVLIRWFASYLNERSHFTQFGKEASDFVNGANPKAWDENNICPEKTYEQALIECGMETLENRREKCV